MDFTQMLMQSLMMFIPTVLGSIIGSLTTIWKSGKAEKQGTTIILRRELRHIHEQICVNGEGCTIDDKDDATDIYEAYKALGGNGTGEAMYKEIMAAKVTQ